MFVNDKTIVALEYIFYQKNGNYRKIKKDKEDCAHIHHLGTDDYIDSVHELSAFKDAPSNYHGSTKDYISEHERHSANKGGMSMNGLKDALAAGIKKDVEGKRYFMETEDGNDACVEGILSLWKIKASGQILKDKEVSFDYKSVFKPTKEGDMKLMLSQDSKIVSLVCQTFTKDDAPGSFEMLAWNVKNLKKVAVPKKLCSTMAQKQEGAKVCEHRFVNKSQHILIVQKRKDEERQTKFHEYFIFDAKTG